MNTDKHKYNLAKDKVRNIQLFYIHFVGYLIVVALIIWNLLIIEKGQFKGIEALNLSVLFGWTVFIIIHGLRVFKSRVLFKKEWETQKMQDFLDKEEKDSKQETTIWE